MFIPDSVFISWSVAYSLPSTGDYLALLAILLIRKNDVKVKHLTNDARIKCVSDVISNQTAIKTTHFRCDIMHAVKCVAHAIRWPRQFVSSAHNTHCLAPLNQHVPNYATKLSLFPRLTFWIFALHHILALQLQLHLAITLFLLRYCAAIILL